MKRWLLGSCVMLGLAAPLAAQDKPAASGHTRAFLDPLGRLWEVPGQDGLLAWFQATDTNHDGFIDRAEIVAAATAWHAKLDLNHDGVIDPDEEAAYEADRSGNHGALLGEGEGFHGGGGDEHRGPEGRRGGRHGRHGGGGVEDEDRTGALMDVANPVISADMNLDRGVSLAEAVGAATRRLALLDMNGDGKLSLAEAQARRASQQSNIRERQHVATPVDQQPQTPN